MTFLFDGDENYAIYDNDEIRVGFEKELFLTKPKLKYHCLLCTNIIRIPKQCPFGHAYCFDCITSYIDNNAQSKCLSCDTTLSIPLLSKNLYLSEDIGNLQVKCRTNLILAENLEPDSSNNDSSPNSWENIDEFTVEETKFCDWTGKLYDLKHHINNDCQYFKVLCNHSGCTSLIKRGLLNDHLSNCLHRLEKCEYCNNLYKFSNLENHKLICIDRPESCVNNCGIIVPYSKLDLHYESCSLHIINCPFGLHCATSCPKQLYRKDIDEHTSDINNLVSAVKNLLNIVENKDKDLKLLTLKSDLIHNMQLSSLYTEILNLSKHVHKDLEKWISTLNPNISSNVNNFDNLLQIKNQLSIKKNEYSVTHITWECDVSEIKLNINGTYDLKEIISPIKKVGNGVNCQLCIDTIVEDSTKYGLYFRLLTNDSVEIDSTCCVLTLLSIGCEKKVIPFSCDFKHLSSQLWNHNSRFYAINKFLPSKEFIKYINNDNVKIIMTLSIKNQYQNKNEQQSKESL